MAVIRPLRAQDDFNEAGEVYVQSWKACYQGLLPQAFLDKLTHDRWSGMLRADPSASLGVSWREGMAYREEVTSVLPLYWITPSL